MKKKRIRSEDCNRNNYYIQCRLSLLPSQEIEKWSRRDLKWQSSSSLGSDTVSGVLMSHLICCRILLGKYLFRDWLRKRATSDSLSFFSFTRPPFRASQLTSQSKDLHASSCFIIGRFRETRRRPIAIKSISLSSLSGQIFRSRVGPDKHSEQISKRCRRSSAWKENLLLFIFPLFGNKLQSGILISFKY